jgi:mannose-6-phosphate isomerase class I
MNRNLRPNYDRFPFIPVDFDASDLQIGWPQITARLKALTAKTSVVCVECYPGVDQAQLRSVLLDALKPECFVDTTEIFKPSSAIDSMVQPHLTNDPVFGRLNGLSINDFFDADKLAAAKTKIENRKGLALVIGVGASLVTNEDDRILVYADLARWEIQLRQRRNELANLGVGNFTARPSEKYKRAYFVDWRVADRLKKKLLKKFDFFLDTHVADEPKMITSEIFNRGLNIAAHRPFRVVPFFDPGPWGGQWMKEVCDLPPDKPNYAWCFDCVPEENSLLLGLGSTRIEMPSLNLVFQHPVELLGDRVHARFGAEFPIRFDFLDTMDGGNLSLQVHPLTEYIHDNFGMQYTQDESYYLLDAGPDATVYLGVKEGVKPNEMISALHHAQTSGEPFPDDKFINRWPAKKHDHFLIPAGTIHCSGKNAMVLEISATPYIFTFKLWDWGRLGLDGRPRPIHIEHGAENIQWSRDTKWVEKNLVNCIEPVAEGPGWKEERTGLHEREFIETRRHWFSAPVSHSTSGGVNVLNLVEGREAIVESPTSAFEPFVVHYAETFIVPACVGAYTIRPLNDGEKSATIKAYVRA